jgi:hypothetical protein
MKRQNLSVIELINHGIKKKMPGYEFVSFAISKVYLDAHVFPPLVERQPVNEGPR